jgi:hypothetical protein
MTRAKIAKAGLVGLVGLLGACADDGTDPLPAIDAAPLPDTKPGTPDATVLAQDYTVPGGGFKEPELSLQAGAQVNVTFTSSAQVLDWNAHTHSGGSTTTLVMGKDQQKTFSVTAGQTGSVWLYFKNPSGGQTTMLHVELELGPGASLVSW